MTREQPLAWRLAAAFILVALGAVAVFAVLVVVIARADLGALGRAQERSATSSLQAAAAAAYLEHRDWKGADLRSVRDLASAADARVEVVEASGAAVAPPAVTGQDVRQSPVVVDHKRVGTLRIRFAASGLLPEERQLRTRLAVATATAGGLAALLAVVVAGWVARRISRPLRRFTRAVQDMEAGDRAARIGPTHGVTELAALASGFDRMADTLDRQDQLREALVSDVAHELRTPIAVLQASTEAVMDGIREPSVEMVSSMHQEVLRLGKRVEDLATITSAETAGLRLARSRVDLTEVATDAAAALRQRFIAAGVSLQLDLTPTVVHGDPARLFQVMSNLLVNATKFTPAGGAVRLTVRPDGGGALLEVADDGVGIGPEEVPHVFERFWRGRSADGREGSGVGLAVVAELAQAHGGTVGVRSTPGEGSTFSIHLPGPPRGAHRV